MSKVTTNRITKDQILGFHSTLVMTIAALIKQRSNINAEPLFSPPPKGKEEENKPTTKELGQRHEIDLNTAFASIHAEQKRAQLTVLDAKVDVLTDVLTQFEEAFGVER
jgi:hypothetical protein